MFLAQSCLLTMSDLFTKSDGFWSSSDVDIQDYLDFGVTSTGVMSDKDTGYVGYGFYIKGDSLVKLNSFAFTKKPNKDTIPCSFIYQTYSPEEIRDISSLPFIIKKQRKSLYIKVKSKQPYETTRNIYISYDIEVGGKHIIKKNVKYKRMLEFTR